MRNYRPDTPESRRRYVAARLLEAAAAELDRAEHHDRIGAFLIATTADNVADNLADVASRLIFGDGDGRDQLAELIEGYEAEATAYTRARNWHLADECQQTAGQIRRAAGSTLDSEEVPA